MAEAQSYNINLREMIKAGVHFGHRKRFWHPSFKEYLFGVRNGLHIIDLDKTKEGLLQAAKYVSNVSEAGKSIMFVCTKTAGQEVIKSEAERCGMPYVNHRWLGGLLSNFDTVLGSVAKLDEYEHNSKPENLRNMTKKEGLRLLAKLRKLEQNLSGVRKMNTLPAALFVVDARHHRIAINEAQKIGIPIIAVVDSNTSSEGIDVVIPGNDDSVHSISIYSSLIADAIIKGSGSANGAQAAAKP